MMLKGLFADVLGLCGVSRGEKECRKSIDNSNAHYSKEFKSDRAHAEAEKEIKQVVQKEQLVTTDHLQNKSTSTSPEDLLPEGVKRFKEEKSARENTLCRRKRRQLRKACEHSCGIGAFDHAD